MLKILLFFIIVSGRKHIFFNILHLDFFFLFWNVPWIASEYWRRFKSPSAAAVQACLTRCTVSHVQQKKVYHEVYNIQIPCFVINDNNFLCLSASDKVSRFVKGVFSVATHHIWTKYQRKILIYFRIIKWISLYSLFQSYAIRWHDQKRAN